METDIHDNKSWVKSLSTEEIYNEEFSIGYIIQSNQHLQVFRDLKDVVLSTYKVRAKFVYLGYNGHSIIANGQTLVYANSKFDKDISLGKNVSYLEGDLRVCGSNRYPHVGNRKGMYCIIEFISYGLPYVDRVDGWSIEVIELIKL